MKKQKNRKMKVWFEEHKDEIKSDLVKLSYYAVGFGVAYFTATKISDLRHTIGLQRLHEAGIFKFFDPDTGLEVNEKEACEVVKRVFKK